MVKPSGTPKVGRWFCPFGIVTSQRSATSSVFLSASGVSLNTSAICSGVFRKN